VTESEQAVADAELMEATAAMLERRYPAEQSEMLTAVITDLLIMARFLRRRAAQAEAAKAS
jgi:hypothetical protein